MPQNIAEIQRELKIGRALVNFIIRNLIPVYQNKNLILYDNEEVKKAYEEFLAIPREVPVGFMTKTQAVVLCGGKKKYICTEIFSNYLKAKGKFWARNTLKNYYSKEEVLKFLEDQKLISPYQLKLIKKKEAQNELEKV